MTELCEIMGQNGAIITLDQEKACDKIRHDYLWRVLEKMNFPTSVILTINSLYTGAETVIILNGEMSKKFPITRGVRQGDPLSCLLFNLAIEPMSHLLRTTNKLSGLSISTQNTHHKLILSLFTYNATLFLSQNNCTKTLYQILDMWCLVSGTKFNKEKTVILPVGTTDYRENIIINKTLPDSIQILKD